MNRIFILLTSVWLISCTQSNKSNSQQETMIIAEPTQQTQSFDWLLGQWERMNEVEGKNTFEHWEKISTSEYTGIGFTMQNGDTVSQEKMKLLKTTDKWELTVIVPEETVTFDIVNYTDSTFVFENKTIDFPNTIKYWKVGDSINASVANSEMEISFVFNRIQ